MKRILKIKTGMVMILCIAAAGSFFLQGTRYMPPDIDHAKVIKGLNAATLKRGKEIYTTSCRGCHGADGTASLPQARSFSKDKLRFGNKPYDMWKTITNGAGMMASQTWLAPAERYYVIQYIREQFMKKTNPKQYFRITDEYLSKLPKSQKSAAEQMAETKKEALKGSLKHGQEWFQHNKSDYGTAIHSQLKGHATSALTVMLDNKIHISYNLLRMGTAAVWQGSLNVSDTKFNRYRGEGEPFMQGVQLKGLDTWQWTYDDKIGELQKAIGVRAPLPAAFMNYHGHYAYGKEVILSYSVMGRKILEFPEAIKNNNSIIISQTLYIESGNKEQKIYIGKINAKGVAIKDSISNEIIVSSAFSKNGFNSFIAAGIISAHRGVKTGIDDQHRLVLTVPANNSPFAVQVLRTSGKTRNDLKAFSAYIKKQSDKKELPNLNTMTIGGAPQWAAIVKADGQTDASKAHFDPRYSEDEDKTAVNKLVPLPDDYPYAVDNIGLPFNNPYNAWVRPSTLGFMNDGRVIIGTYTGDVWEGTGIDSTLKNISWRRIAAGLYEPMGMKVINDNIYVTCRNGIVLLHDLNGDMETDFYETFHADNDVSGFFHAFNFGLETDSKGNFYYAKPGEYTDNRDPGNVIKVSADGKSWESIGTGFRVDNGITVTPDDRIFVSDNQGNWTPGNKINLIEKNAFYGYVPNIVEDGWSPDGIKYKKEDLKEGVINPEIIKVPETFHPPALWMPQEFDNSPGGGVWSDNNWGPLGNHFIHTSYGTGWAYYFLTHKVDGITQGAMIAMPFQMEAGIQRAAVNPADKQIYTTGLTGWDDGVSSKYGVLSRIRYKGNQGHLIMDAEVVKGGVQLKFNFRLSADVKDIENYDIAQWNYKWQSKYGSAHYSVKDPGREGEDNVMIREAVPSEDGRSIFLSLPDIAPVQSMRIRFSVKGEDGVVVKNSVYLTIHKVPE